MSFKNKSVLVTGGARFIGSLFVDEIIKEMQEKKNYNDLTIYYKDVSDYSKKKYDEKKW